MATIKSALEIALERTKDIKFDQVALESAELKTEGKKNAAKFMENGDIKIISEAITKIDKEKKLILATSICEVLLSYIQLPTTDLENEKAEKAFTGIACLGGILVGSSQEKSIQGMSKQVLSFFTQYSQEMQKAETAIRQQWAPKLQEKERMLAAQYGQHVKIDPMSDPEFAAFYKENITSAKQQYQGALDQAKDQIRKGLKLVS